MNQYTYFALGIVLGISLAVYYFMNREEKIESRIKLDQKIYSTKLLDITMESVVKKINEKIKLESIPLITIIFFIFLYPYYFYHLN